MNRGLTLFEVRMHRLLGECYFLPGYPGMLQCSSIVNVRAPRPCNYAHSLRACTQWTRLSTQEISVLDFCSECVFAILELRHPALMVQASSSCRG